MRKTSDPVKKKQYHVVQEMLKLMINLVYGCITSVYFPTNNTVIANNITARCRVEVWKLAKALSLCNTITDGGMYEAHKIPFLKQGGKKPGMATLSDIRKLEKHRSIRVGPLGGIDWTRFSKNQLIPRISRISIN